MKRYLILMFLGMMNILIINMKLISKYIQKIVVIF